MPLKMAGKRQMKPLEGEPPTSVKDEGHVEQVKSVLERMSNVSHKTIPTVVGIS